jgi:hypothetical protein
VDFDLFGASNVSDEMLESMDRFLQFETILRYVFLPDGCFLTSNRKQVSDAKGKDRFLSVFKWLNKKGVKKIIRIVVCDDQQTPHTEDAIGRALERFDVEELDWRKNDICSETIRHSAPNVRILHLSWSGSNPVLRAWSAADGLLLLQKVSGPSMADIEPNYLTALRTWTKYFGANTYMLNQLERIHLTISQV